MKVARDTLGASTRVQGNLDPMILFGSEEVSGGIGGWALGKSGRALFGGSPTSAPRIPTHSFHPPPPPPHGTQLCQPAVSSARCDGDPPSSFAQPLTACLLASTSTRAPRASIVAATSSQSVTANPSHAHTLNTLCTSMWLQLAGVEARSANPSSHACTHTLRCLRSL